MNYKGYHGVYDYNQQTGLFAGAVMNIAANVEFGAACEGDMFCEFRRAVDTYIAECEHRGQFPEPPGPITPEVFSELQARRCTSRSERVAQAARQILRAISPWHTPHTHRRLRIRMVVNSEGDRVIITEILDLRTGRVVRDSPPVSMCPRDVMDFVDVDNKV